MDIDDHGPAPGHLDTPNTRVRPMSRNAASSRQSSRRDFLDKTARGIAAGFAFPAIVPDSALGLGGKVAPSNRVTLGVIGTGNQGFNDIKSFLKDERVQI